MKPADIELLERIADHLDFPMYSERRDAEREQLWRAARGLIAEQRHADRATLLTMSATISASAFGPSWRKEHDEIAKQAVALARAIIAEVDGPKDEK